MSKNAFLNLPTAIRPHLLFIIALLFSLSLPGCSDNGNNSRFLFGQEVQGEFNLSYCENGSLEDCRDSLWSVVEQVIEFAPTN